MSGMIAIVGRPNVGKSALFNRLVGRRIAIVHDEPGVTRDRIMAETEWKGRSLTIVDTSGIGLAAGERAADVLERAALDQVELAVASAQVMILVVDIVQGLTPLDEMVADRLRRHGKPVVVAANKADHEGLDGDCATFERMGFAGCLPVSAIHGRGVGPLLRAAVERLPKEARGAEPAGGEGQPPMKIAIVGRPNVGKSSLTNALVGDDRVVVTPIPGTTRDAVDVPFEFVHEGVRERYVLIDTAGLRKRRRVDDSIEFFSVKRAEESVQRCDLVVMVVDAESGILEQDKKIGDLIQEHCKPCVVVVNKWDLVAPLVAAARKKGAGKAPRYGGAKPPPATLAEFGRWVQEQLFFLDYAPVVFASASSGYHLDRLLEAIRFVGAQMRQRVPTALLNRALREAVERRQPPSAAGKHMKFFYATQVETTPPTFWLFVNRRELWTPSYGRYLASELRKAFGFEGCPLVLVPRPRRSGHEK